MSITLFILSALSVFDIVDLVPDNPSTSSMYSVPPFVYRVSVGFSESEPLPNPLNGPEAAAPWNTSYLGILRS